MLSFFILSVIVGCVLGSFELTCPPGYVVQGQAVHTEGTQLQATSIRGFLLCIVCEADSYRKDSLDVCLPRWFFSDAQFARKNPGFVIAVHFQRHRHAWTCADDGYAHADHWKLFLLGLDYCVSHRVCGLVFESKNGTLQEPAHSAKAKGCSSRSPLWLQDNFASVVRCYSNAVLTGVAQFIDYFFNDRPSTCGICSPQPGDSEKTFYVCRRNIARDPITQQNDLFYKCLKDPCEEIHLKASHEDACGFTLEEGPSMDEFQANGTVKILACEEEDEEAAAAECDYASMSILSVLLGCLSAILFLGLLAILLYIHCMKEKENVGNQAIEQELQVRLQNDGAPTDEPYHYEQYNHYDELRE